MALDEIKQAELRDNIKLRIDKVLILEDEIVEIVREIRIYKKELENMWELDKIERMNADIMQSGGMNGSKNNTETKQENNTNP